MTDNEIRVVAALMVAGAAMLCDLRTRRIPNLLTFGAAALAAVAGLVFGGLWGLLQPSRVGPSGRHCSFRCSRWEGWELAT